MKRLSFEHVDGGAFRGQFRIKVKFKTKVPKKVEKCILAFDLPNRKR